MNFKLIALVGLSGMIAACNPGYQNHTLSAPAIEEKVVTQKKGPRVHTWVFDEEGDVSSVNRKPSDDASTKPPTAEEKPVAETPAVPDEDESEHIESDVIADQGDGKKELSGKSPETHPTDFKKAGNITPTVYYIPLINETKRTCKDAELKPMLSSTGETLAKVCPRTYEGCALQGSCFVTTKDTSAILNHLRVSGGVHRFFEVDMETCPFGQGVRSGCLDPYYTVAADLNFFKAGDVIYVPAVRGLLLPNGDTHHGFFIVRDMGGVIDGEGRFDFFSGFNSWRDKRNPFSQMKLTDKNTQLPYYRVSGQTAEAVRQARNYPSLPQLTLTQSKTP